jgi:molybdopterin/thiamine biosynthesis adenylyltransferase
LKNPRPESQEEGFLIALPPLESLKTTMQRSARILIVGVGGLGVPAAIALARAGGCRLTLLDPDRVELSNLARQVIYRDEDLGKPKAERAARHLREEVANAAIDALVESFEPRNAVVLASTHDVIIDATDDPATKFLINDTALETGHPFVYGGVLGMAGQAMTVIPGQTACLRCLFEEPPGEAEIATCREAGIVGPVAGVIGEAQALEAIALIAGAMPRLAGRILTYDATDTARLRTTEVPARSGCRCGAWRGKSAAAMLHQ